MIVSRRKGLRGLAWIMSICLVFLAAVPAVSGGATQAYAEPIGNVYYVDSEAGDDESEGTGEGENAWRSLEKVNATIFEPGDSILFKRGGTWLGTLHPKGSGEPGSPIVIDEYGDEEELAPLINGNGNEAAVYLYNQQYWEVSNLEVTNDDGDRSAINQRTKKNGIYVVNDDAGTLNHIRIIGNNVHDVYGNNVKDGNGSSGIKIRTKAGDVPSNFNGIRIEGNTVGPRVDRTGIDMNSDYWCRLDSGCTGTPNWYPSHDVMIQNNYVHDVGGDGIVPMATLGAIVQYNTVNGFNMRSGVVNAGIWAWNADDTVIQFNEASNGHTTQDGQGFDIDYGQSGTIIQYNYSHDNDGGFILICQPSGAVNDGGIVRYNISQNDKERVFQLSGPTTNTQVYNNTIYLGQGSTSKPIYASSWGGYTKSISFTNNVFYLEGAGAWEGLSNVASFTFDHNTIYGVHSNGEPADANKSTLDPKFIYPGSGDIGRDTLDGYKLAVDSPAIGSGALIADNGGLDYWGNEVSTSERPNRGAYNGPGMVPEHVPVSRMELDDRRIILQLGEQSDIPVLILPGNATDKTFAVSSSDESVVAASGSFGSIQLEAGVEGDAVITVTATEGGLVAEIRVTVVPPFQYENKYMGNPGFENETLSPWGSWKTGSAVGNHARSGSKAGSISSSEGSLEQAVSNLLPNTTYRLSGYGKVTNGADSMDIGVKNYGSGQVVKAINSLEYEEATFKFTTGPSNTGAAVFCYRWNGAAFVYCDDFSLTEYVVGLHVDEEELVMKVGQERVIDAVVLPFDAPNRNVRADLEDPSLAEVTTSRGVVTIKAIAEGSTVLRLTSVDGGQTAEIELSIEPVQLPEPSQATTPEPTPNPTNSPTAAPTPKPTPVPTASPAPLPFDVQDHHWAAGAVKQALQQGFVIGYEDGGFKPDKPVTRSEFATMLGRAFGLSSKGDSAGFADEGQIPSWARQYVAGAVNAGILSGYEDGKFRSDRGLTRGEMAAMIVRLLGITELSTTTPPFSDWDVAPEWARPYIATAFEQGLMQGTGWGRFAPERPTTRAEAVTLIVKLLTLIQSNDE